MVDELFTALLILVNFIGAFMLYVRYSFVKAYVAIFSKPIEEYESVNAAKEVLAYHRTLDLGLFVAGFTTLITAFSKIDEKTQNLLLIQIAMLVGAAVMFIGIYRSFTMWGFAQRIEELDSHSRKPESNNNEEV